MIFERSELMHAQDTAIGMRRIMIIQLELGVPHFQTKAHMQTTQLGGQIPINIRGWEVATSGLQLQLGMLLGCLYRRIEQIHKHPIIASWFVAVEGVPEQIPTSLLCLFSTNKV